MKKLLAALFLLLLICCKESGVQLAKPGTFVRYFSGGFPDQSQAIIETADNGFLILANTLPSATNNHYKIKLIKTDAYGNQEWQRFFPDYEVTTAVNPPDFRGFGLAAIHDNSDQETGYVIVGDSIKGNNHALLMIQVDKTGSTKATKIFKDLNVQGMGVAQAKSTGDFFVLGKSYSTGLDDMFFAQVTSTAMDTVWRKTYGAASTQLTNRVFFDATEKNAYWGGTRTDVTGSKIRFTRAGFDSKSVGFDLSYPVGGTTSLVGSDMCQYGFQYAFVGGSVIGNNQFDGIVFNRVNVDGGLVAFQEYDLHPELKDTDRFPQVTPPGNSICSTSDGGFLLLGTLALDAQGTDSNYLLIKIGSDGTEQWRKLHGSKFIDVGTKVLQASDGGYVVLGTTTLANVQSIFLMKTDMQGSIQ